MSNWHPAEEAPFKTPVLCYEKGGFYVGMRVMAGWYTSTQVINDGPYYEWIQGEPSHFMFLPNPPGGNYNGSNS